MLREVIVGYSRTHEENLFLVFRPYDMVGGTEKVAENRSLQRVAALRTQNDPKGTLDLSHINPHAPVAQNRGVSDR